MTLTSGNGAPASRGYELLLEAVRDSGTLRTLGDREWEALLGEAAEARLLGRLVDDCERVGLAVRPGWLADRLAGARALSAECERALRWEIGRVRRALRGLDVTWVLLKGAGYVAAGLPPSHGRLVADIDVLVPAADLPRVEAALREWDWEPEPLDDYDARYYRQWMHEIPPLVHRERRSVLDLHHAILPRTSRLQADSAVLLARAVQVDDGVRVLCPTHMVLHAAVHLFHDGQIGGAVRDLVDLDGLLRFFPAADPAFWTTLRADAEALGLERPAFYAVRYAARVLGTPVPRPFIESIAAWAPPAPLLTLMDALVDRVLGRRGGGAAAFALYVRSHWLRMPPGLLVRHLGRKAWGRAAGGRGTGSGG